MKAIVQTCYGTPDGFEVRDIEKPKLTKGDAVLVRVHAAALHAGDVFMMRGVPYFTRFVVGLPKPRDYIPGYDVSGRVEAVGREVTQFRPGDAVYGSVSRACAAYAVASQSALAPRPSGITHEQAAAVPTSATAALRGIRDVGRVGPQHKVLINGASGGVGTYAVQIAKALEAEVTGVCSTGNVELVRSIGADHVIDYTKDDFTQGRERYDLFLDTVANHSLSDCRRALTPTGVHLPNSGNAGMTYVLKAMLASIFIRRQGSTHLATPNQADLAALSELIGAGKLTPVVDRIRPLTDFVEAMRYLDQGHARGKVVLTIWDESHRG
jgi:NADPH:quinone reductase-like Zn-dependent oxidoreductase